VLYTGQGGNEAQGGGVQIADQQWTKANAGLAANAVNGNPLRLVRGPRHRSAYAPPAGFRYDGLYYVRRFWEEQGRSGFRICRFLLIRDDPDPSPWVHLTHNATATRRTEGTIQRLVRNTTSAWRIKHLHSFACQICGVRLDTPAGPYAEAAHIRPLGTPHNGPDTEDNILCLCPNHHVLLDTGALVIHADGTLSDGSGKIRELPSHAVSRNHLLYHARHIARPQ
jgi:putative restriction endonuclease